MSSHGMFASNILFSCVGENVRQHGKNIWSGRVLLKPSVPLCSDSFYSPMTSKHSQLRHTRLRSVTPYSLINKFLISSSISSFAAGLSSINFRKIGISATHDLKARTFSSISPLKASKAVS